MAGEVAEPYRVLVVANYPASFSDIAQRRLISIAQSGPRCGVYVLVSVDTKLANATGQLAKDLEPNCVNLAWKDGKFLWKDTAFEQYPLRLDTPPEDFELNRIVKLAGEAAKQAKPNDREAVRRVLTTLAPTFKSGTPDLAGALVGPDAKGKYAVLAAVVVKDGKDIEKLVKDFAPFIPADQT